MEPSEDEQAGTEEELIGILDLSTISSCITMCWPACFHNQSPAVVFSVFYIM